MRYINLLFVVCLACGGGGGADAPGPVVVLLSPLPGTATEGTEIIVYGTAERATSVTVNGRPATSKDGFANWQGRVDLGPGENTLVVEARNDAGLTTIERRAVERRTVVSGTRWFTYDRIRKVFYAMRLDPAALVTIRAGRAYASEEFPAADDVESVRRWRGAYSAARESVFLYDPDRAELVKWYEETGAVTEVSSATRGAGPAFEPSDRAQALAVDDARGKVILVHRNGAMEIDMDSGDRTAISLPAGAPLGSAYNPATQELFIWHSATNWPVSATHVATGASRTILGRTNWLGGTPFTVDHDNNRLLVANGNQSGDVAFGIHAYDLDTGAHTKLASHAVNRPVGLIHESGVIYLLDADYTRSMIRRFDLATGTETTEWTSARGAGPDLGSAESMVFDSVENKLVVSSSNFGEGTVLFVDPRTGDRELWRGFMEPTYSVAYAAARDEFAVGLYDEVVLSSRDRMQNFRMTLGEGARGPRHLVLDSANNNGWYWNGALFRLDLGSGAQSPVDVPLDIVRALVFDPARNAVFAADDGLSPRLQKLDVATETLTPVPNGIGDMTALAMAPDGTRLLVGKRNELHLMSPDSGAGTIVSSPMFGTGPTLGHAIAMVVDPRDPNWLYVLSGEYQVQIVMVDLRTGDRYLVAK